MRILAECVDRKGYNDFVLGSGWIKVIGLLVLFSLLFGLCEAVNSYLTAYTKSMIYADTEDILKGEWLVGQNIGSTRDVLLNTSITTWISTTLGDIILIVILSGLIFGFMKFLGSQITFSIIAKTAVYLLIIPLICSLFSTTLNVMTYFTLGDVSIINRYLTPAIGMTAYYLIFGDLLRDMSKLPRNKYIPALSPIAILIAFTILGAVYWIWFTYFLTESAANIALRGLGI